MQKIMIIGAAVAVVVAIVLFTGVFTPTSKESSPPEQVPGKEAKKALEDIYQGFMSVERGSWAEYKHIINGETTIMKAIYAGKETFEGETYTGFEFEILSFPTEGMQQIGLIATQVWHSPTGAMVVYKTTEGVFKGLEIKQEMEIYAETPDFFKPENIPEGWEEFTFTTETGKTVRGIKFKNPDGEEIWLSGEVPFGIVKYIAENLVSELRDFGVGAELKISIEEVKNARSL